MTARNVFFVGAALLTAAAASDGIVSALVAAGILCVVYAFVVGTNSMIEKETRGNRS